jgi:hypothetical protein
MTDHTVLYYPRDDSKPFIMARESPSIGVQMRRDNTSVSGALRHLRASSPGGATDSFRLDAISDVNDALAALHPMVR